MRSIFSNILMLATMAAAAPTSSVARDVGAQNLLIGGPSQILTARFEGNKFNMVGKNVSAGSAPSWMRYKHSTDTLYAVNENGADLNIFTLKRDDALALKFAGSATGSSGVVFLEFNKEQTRMVGAGYGSEMIDIWDTSATGPPKLLKHIKIAGPLGPDQTAHHPHQAIHDPSGGFMVIPDLGGDQLLVLDIRDDKFEITNSVTLSPGSGPRHGSFISAAGGKTFFVVVTEKSNLLVLYEAEYNDQQGIAFKYISELSTYGDQKPKDPSTAAAGAILVARNAKDIYVSNRLTGDNSDNIAHFTFDAATPAVTFVDLTPTTGKLPRSMGFGGGKEQPILFVANQGGENGLVALTRNTESGSLVSKPIAVVANADLIPEGLEGTENVGPQFISSF